MNNSDMDAVFFGIVALVTAGVFLYLVDKITKSSNINNSDNNNEAQPNRDWQNMRAITTSTSTESSGGSMRFADDNQRRRYFDNKSQVERAIAEKDYEYLEAALDTRITDFKDLKEMIEEALRNKPKDEKQS